MGVRCEICFVMIHSEYLSLCSLWNKEAPNESPFPLGNKTKTK